jgi:N-acetyl-gamma-glutamyl-phosphate reductase common form
MAALRAGIVGGSGFGGGELLRILSRHPEVRVTAVTSRRHAGRPVADVHLNLLGHVDLMFADLEADDLAKEVDVLFFALPHGEAAKRMTRVLDAAPELRIVDLSGDFRLNDVEEWERAYGREHPAGDLSGEFVYGLTEAFRDQIRQSRRVANPGCFATGAILALLPLAEEGLLDGNVAISGITGSSGSGAEPKMTTHHPERTEDFRAYRPLTHQHEPEIRLALERAGAGAGGFSPAMVPHSAPFVRGIFTTASIFPTRPLSREMIRGLYEARYGPEPFVRLREDTPRVTVVRGTNHCDVAVTADDEGKRLVVLSAIDNLVKGMAGQAVQNMNLLFDLAESAGLLDPGTHP